MVWRASCCGILTALLLAIASSVPAQDWRGRGRLQGRVVNAEGKPLAGVQVLVRWGENEDSGPDPMTTDNKGHWEYLGLTGGTWIVSFEADGYVPSEATVRVSEYDPGPPLRTAMEPVPEGVLKRQRMDAALERLEKGNALMEQQQYAAARGEYEAALPELDLQAHPVVLLGIARTHYQEGHLDLAIASLERALEIDPAHVEALKLICSMLVADGREEEAQVYMARLPEEEKLDPDAVLNIGIRLYNEQKLEEAVKQFDRVVRDFPELADAYYYRGLVLLNQGKNDLAAADLRRLLELDPDHAKAEEARQFLEYLESQ